MAFSREKDLVSRDLGIILSTFLSICYDQFSGKESNTETQDERLLGDNVTESRIRHEFQRKVKIKEKPKCPVTSQILSSVRWRERPLWSHRALYITSPQSLLALTVTWLLPPNPEWGPPHPISFCDTAQFTFGFWLVQDP